MVNQVETPHLKISGYVLRCVCNARTPFRFLDEKKACVCGKMLEVTAESKKRFIQKYQLLGRT